MDKGSSHLPNYLCLEEPPLPSLPNVTSPWWLLPFNRFNLAWCSCFSNSYPGVFVLLLSFLNLSLSASATSLDNGPLSLPHCLFFYIFSLLRWEVWSFFLLLLPINTAFCHLGIPSCLLFFYFAFTWHVPKCFLSFLPFSFFGLLHRDPTGLPGAFT